MASLKSATQATLSKTHRSSKNRGAKLRRPELPLKGQQTAWRRGNIKLQTNINVYKSVVAPSLVQCRAALDPPQAPHLTSSAAPAASPFSTPKYWATGTDPKSLQSWDVIGLPELKPHLPSEVHRVDGHITKSGQQEPLGGYRVAETGGSLLVTEGRHTPLQCVSSRASIPHSLFLSRRARKFGLGFLREVFQGRGEEISIFYSTKYPILLYTYLKQLMSQSKYWAKPILILSNPVNKSSRAYFTYKIAFPWGNWKIVTYLL